MSLIHRRKHNRWSHYNYSNPGSYFVTFCTHHRVPWFGEIIAGQMHYSPYGLIAFRQWQAIPQYYTHITIDEFVIMPDHVHGIITIDDGDPMVGTGYYPVPTYTPVTATNSGRHDRYGMVSKIIKSYKHAVTQYIRIMGQAEFAWQRSFHDHIIRTDRELYAIRRYIQNNPKHWRPNRSS